MSRAAMVNSEGVGGGPVHRPFPGDVSCKYVPEESMRIEAKKPVMAAGDRRDSVLHR
jgi:hypothetical protein